ncbi:sigma-70 family RNA polymerase sigma factor [Candidatus Uhrbacteria bacterium]|nr:sigma-70 family RNA polymerase sigma factor [Candidatus Uhrbacteria bacterium]
MRRFLNLKLPTPHDADDAVSTVFLRLWNYLTDTKVESVSGLLFTIARGVVAEFYRQRKPELVELPSMDEFPELHSASVRQTGEVALVRRALAHLNEDEQQVITLRFFEGYSVRELAFHFQKTENATRVMLHRALKSLRRIFDPL